tara:strand:+ start:877 stop:3477 length:2601 start_codon:yes stop_codon:yes gene_type:complete
MQDRDYRENQHPPYCTCVDCTKGLNKSRKNTDTKNISKILKRQKKKKKKKNENSPAELEYSVFDSPAYKNPDWKPPKNAQKVTVSRKKTVKKKKVKADRSYELNVKTKRADDFFKNNQASKKTKQEKKNNKNPKNISKKNLENLKFKHQRNIIESNKRIKRNSLFKNIKKSLLLIVFLSLFGLLIYFVQNGTIDIEQARSFFEENLIEEGLVSENAIEEEKQNKEEQTVFQQNNNESDLSELRSYALELINELRTNEGLNELILSENPTAQILADHSFQTRLYGKMLSNGKTDEMIYFDNGGNSYINTIGSISGYFNKKNDGTYDWSEDSNCRVNPLVSCQIVNPKKQIKSFIESDTNKKWITKSSHKKFNIGVSYDSYLFFSYLSFEGGDFTINKFEIDGSIIDLEIENNTDEIEFSDNLIQIFFQPLPGNELPEKEFVIKENYLNSIQNNEVALITKPPENESGEIFSRIYVDPYHVVADIWEVENKKFKLRANIGKYIKEPGFYSISIWGNNIQSKQSEMLINVGNYKNDNEVTEKVDVLKNDFSLTEIREYVLELINKDRADHGVDPVELGNDETAQIHAEESFKNDYHSHWFLSGEKPYMVYSRNGGKSYVAENGASQTGGDNISFECRENPVIRCAKIDIKEHLKRRQWNMMYDDAHADWGHRDNIINPKHNKVNLGIVFDDYVYSFIQHFEADHFEIENVKLDGSNLTFEIINNTMEYGYSDASIEIIYDPLPEPLTTDWLNDSEIKKAMGYGYCYGGGTNCYKDENGERLLDEKEYQVAFILKPPRDGYYYSDLDPEDVVANGWQFTNQGNNTDPHKLRVRANLGDRLDKEGIYTIIIWGDHKVSGETHSLINYSFQK